MKLRCGILIGCCLVVNLPAYSQGYIVTNGVTTDSGNGIYVVQNPTSGDYTGFMLADKGNGTFQFSPLVDEGVRTFIVSENDAISLQPIIAGAYPEMTDPNAYILTDGLPFYLGFYTGYFSSVPGIYKDPVFGWGEFVNNNGTIELLDSALVFGGDGIYAGTLNIIQAVPEPGTLGLVALGGLLLGYRHRSRSS